MTTVLFNQDKTKFEFPCCDIQLRSHITDSLGCDENMVINLSFFVKSSNSTKFKFNVYTNLDEVIVKNICEDRDLKINNAKVSYVCTEPIYKEGYCKYTLKFESKEVSVVETKDSYLE